MLCESGPWPSTPEGEGLGVEGGGAAGLPQQPWNRTGTPGAKGNIDLNEMSLVHRFHNIVLAELKATMLRLSIM